MSIFGRLICAVAIGVLVTLGCLLVGGLLAIMAPSISWVVYIGNFLVQWSGLIGLLVGILVFFTGWGPTWMASRFPANR